MQLALNYHRNLTVSKVEKSQFCLNHAFSFMQLLLFRIITSIFQDQVIWEMWQWYARTYKNESVELAHRRAHILICEEKFASHTPKFILNGADNATESNAQQFIDKSKA